MIKLNRDIMNNVQEGQEMRWVITKKGTKRIFYLLFLIFLPLTLFSVALCCEILTNIGVVIELIITMLILLWLTFYFGGEKGENWKEPYVITINENGITKTEKLTKQKLVKKHP